MVRPLRIQFENAHYHVTARGNERRDIVIDDNDCAKWIKYLAKTGARHELVIYAFVLMDNHYHLFARTPQANLSRAVHDLNASYAGWFNRRHRRVGHLLSGRFKAILVDSEGYYWEVSRYIHLNPVRENRGHSFMSFEEQEIRTNRDILDFMTCFCYHYRHAETTQTKSAP